MRFREWLRPRQKAMCLHATNAITKACMWMHSHWKILTPMPIGQLLPFKSCMPPVGTSHGCAVFAYGSSRISGRLIRRSRRALRLSGSVSAPWRAYATAALDREKHSVASNRATRSPRRMPRAQRRARSNRIAEGIVGELAQNLVHVAGRFGAASGADDLGRNAGDRRIGRHRA